MVESVIIGGATLYLGDCREILPLLSGIDACVTDPPYGIGIASNPFRQKYAPKEWDAVAADLSVLPTGVPTIVWGGNYFNLPPAKGFLIWDKVQPFDFSSAQCEFAWTNQDRPAKLFRRRVVGFEKHHPTTKPLDLMVWCLEWLGEGKTILDPFMGSGTTGVACAKLGRKFIGIELDERYFDIACRRICEAYAQPDMFIESPPKAVQTALDGL